MATFPVPLNRSRRTTRAHWSTNAIGDASFDRDIEASKNKEQRHKNMRADQIVTKLSCGINGDGTIRFPGSRQRNSKWVRVLPDAPPEMLVQVLSDMWNLKLPSVVISVTGDAAFQYNLPERVQVQFKRRLREVSLRTKVIGQLHTPAWLSVR